MLFLTYWFVIFAAVTFPLYWLVCFPLARLILLFVFCAVFHTHFAGPAGVLPIVVLGLMTYAVGLTRNRTACVLGIAACVAAGLWGVANEVELDVAETIGSGYALDGVERLPRTLIEATARLADSKVARELFGDGFVEHYVATREWEWRQAQEAVTDWELARYFEII